MQFIFLNLLLEHGMIIASQLVFKLLSKTILFASLFCISNKLTLFVFKAKINIFELKAKFHLSIYFQFFFKLPNY